MKKYILDFLHRGLMAWGFGPIILTVIYMIVYRVGDLQALTVPQVCLGILSLSGLAFVAGGMNCIYQVERLPLMAAILIHGSVLYLSYLATYLLNSWLEWGIAPILVFTGIFVVGYLAIWAVIYSIIRKNTAKINEMLKEQQQNAG